MNKEREAFEEWCVKDDEFCIHRYDGSDEYSDDYTQCAWMAWQAAKSKAVPEGFVVVNKEDLAKVLNCVSDDWLIDTESLEEFKNIESLVKIEIESMIESWSQNDH